MIKIGDVVRFRGWEGRIRSGLVMNLGFTMVDTTTPATAAVYYPEGPDMLYINIAELEETGRHIDLDEIFKALEEEQP